MQFRNSKTHTSTKNKLTLQLITVKEFTVGFHFVQKYSFMNLM